MGGEGANWVGEAPFSKRKHVFQNIGDGTYNHSGLMAIRQAVAAGTTITYKILFNDAVAMTGGQKNDGGLTVEQIAAQMRAIGVERIAVGSGLTRSAPVRFRTRDAWARALEHVGLRVSRADALPAREGFFVPPSVFVAVKPG